MEEKKFIGVRKEEYAIKDFVKKNFGKGKIYNSELRTINGKCYVYINSENIPHDTHIPPRSRKIIPEKT